MLVIALHTVLPGIGERTSVGAVETLAQALFEATPVDGDAFVVHPEIDRLLRVHRLTRAGAKPAPAFRQAVAEAL